MMKKKRKYTRKIDVESKSTPAEEESNSRPPSEVIQADISMLPPSLKSQLEAGTKQRALANRISKGQYPDNLKERTEQMVRRFQGDRPR